MSKPLNGKNGINHKNEKNLEVKEQVEYYLSDKNLEKDMFFHEIIESDVGRYLDLQYILKCNKIKKKGWTKDDLKAGIKLSSLLELDETGEKVRRKDGSLPEMLFLSKKRKKPEKSKKSKKEKGKDKIKTEEKIIKKEPIIFRITCKENTSLTWKSIFEVFKKLNPELDVVYGRFKGKEGHIGIFLKENQTTENLKLTDNFIVDKIDFNVKRCEGENLTNFWKEHGKHYEFCTSKREKHKKAKEEKARKNKKTLSEHINLGKRKFNNIDLIKSETKKILNKYKDNENLKGDDKDFILDLLKYHHNYEEKVKDMDYITVGSNEKYKYSKCFFVVDKNGKRTDFSTKKCINNLIDKLFKV